MSRIKVVDVTKRVPGTWPTLDKDSPIMQLRQQVDEVRTLNLKGQKLKVKCPEMVRRHYVLRYYIDLMRVFRLFLAGLR